jgi:hypothetical protein
VGNVVELTANVPSGSTLSPMVRLLDSSGSVVTEQFGGLTYTIDVDDVYYAQVISRQWEYGGHEYRWLGSQTWPEAQSSSESLDGYLVSINDAAEYSFVRNTFYPMGQHHWIGLSDSEEEGNWSRWTDGSVVSYANWNEGEPDSGANYDYAFQHHGNGLWYDDRSNRRRHGVVEIPQTALAEGTGPGPLATYVLGVVGLVRD